MDRKSTSNVHQILWEAAQQREISTLWMTGGSVTLRHTFCQSINHLLVDKHLWQRSSVGLMLQGERIWLLVYNTSAKQTFISILILNSLLNSFIFNLRHTLTFASLSHLIPPVALFSTLSIRSSPAGIYKWMCLQRREAREEKRLWHQGRGEQGSF